MNATGRLFGGLFGVREVALAAIAVQARDDEVSLRRTLNAACDLGDAVVAARPLLLREGVDRGARGSDGGIELYVDGHAAALIAVRLRVTCALDPAQAQSHLAAVAKVVPPALALRPADRDPHAVAVLPVTDRKCVRASATPARDSDQRELAADQAMQGRAQQGCDHWVGCAIEDREGSVAAAHRAYLGRVPSSSG